MTLDEAAQHIGHQVTYRPHGGHHEHGTITAVTSRYVFVRYGQDRHSKATTADALHLETAGGP
jgi:hypothetical protein